MSVNEKMTAIADAIRTKTGGTDSLTLDGMAEAINGLEIGVELPTLTNEGSASDLIEGKQFIDGNGNIITGVFSIDDEISTQNDLIVQIQNVVDNLPEAGSGGGNGSTSSGICPSLTITTEDVTINDLVYSTNNEYVNGGYISSGRTVTFNNIDIDKPIFVSMINETGGPIDYDSENADVVYMNSGYTVAVIECLSTSSATVELYIDIGLGGEV